MKWTNGKHPYKGETNSRAERSLSKITKGMKIRKKATINAFKKIEQERINKLKNK